MSRLKPALLCACFVGLSAAGMLLLVPTRQPPTEPLPAPPAPTHAEPMAPRVSGSSPSTLSPRTSGPHPRPPAHRLGPLDGAHLTATVDAFLFTEQTPRPLDRDQRQRAIEMIQIYLRASDVSEGATTQFDSLLTGSQRVRLKSYPLGAAVDLPPSDLLIEEVLQRLSDYKPKPAAPLASTPDSQDFPASTQPPKMIRVLEGLYQMLEDPACDLTQDQVNQAKETLEGTQEALSEMQRVDIGMRAILSEEQIRQLPPDIGGAEHDRSVLRALAAWLQGGGQAPSPSGWDPPARRQGFTTNLMTFGTGLVLLAQKPDLQPDPAQRSRLLAQVKTSLAAVEAIVAASHECLDALSFEHWKAIYSSPVEEAFRRTSPGGPQTTLEALVRSYQSRASAQVSERSPVNRHRFDHTTPPFIRMLEGLSYLEGQEDSPYRPTSEQARILHDALSKVGREATIYWSTPAALFELLTSEQVSYLHRVDVELHHEQNYVATLLLMLHLQSQVR